MDFFEKPRICMKLYLRPAYFYWWHVQIKTRSIDTFVWNDSAQYGRLERTV